jgi:hypothetical protein
LVERLSLQVLYALPETAAEQTPERAREIARFAGDLPRCPERSGERSRHDERVGPAGDGEGAARDRPVDLGV